jgi:hypothetical protein
LSAAPLYEEAISAVAHRSRRLRRLMVAAQRSALRRAKAGQHRLASQRWGLLLELHCARQELLRAWGLL